METTEYFLSWSNVITSVHHGFVQFMEPNWAGVRRLLQGI